MYNLQLLEDEFVNTPDDVSYSSKGAPGLYALRNGIAINLLPKGLTAEQRCVAVQYLRKTTRRKDRVITVTRIGVNSYMILTAYNGAVTVSPTGDVLT